MITVVDYGMGNLWSVTNALKRYTDEVRVSSKPSDITEADKMILPGVGAFKDAYDGIARRGILDPILDFIKSGRVFMGICLGLQLLFTKSYEGGEHKGFGIIKGEVVGFLKDKGLKIPHMGWNTITQSAAMPSFSKALSKKDRPSYSFKGRALWGRRKALNCPLLRGVPEGAHMYFVHSYYCVPQDRRLITTTTSYGVEFCSLLWKDNIYAMQFHPEKSQSNGLKIIENFVRL